MKLVWFPTWRCNNYADETRCPYCPYGWDSGKECLTFQGLQSSYEGEIEPEKIRNFLAINMEYLNGKVEITGGEPLMYPYLTDVLDSNIRWAITSNTSMVSRVRRLASKGILERCFSWTASWHPFSRREAEFTECVNIIAMANVPVAVTVVVSEETLPILQKIKDFLSGLPITSINWHLEAHKKLEFDLAGEAEKIVGKVHWIAGEPRQGALCKKNSDLLALAPSGDLYNCVTHCYTNTDVIGNIKESIQLNELDKIVEQCDDECFACCDWIKHIIL